MALYRYIIAMYIESVPNRNSPPAILLRESFRDGAKIKKRTIANLSDWPAELVEGLRTLLKGGTATPADRESIIVRRALPHGHVAAVLGTLRAIGLDRILGPAGNRPRDLVIAMIVARLIAPASKLATARMLDPATAASSLGDILGLGAVDEDELYAAIDWLGERQGAIEQAGIEYRDCAGLETVAFFVCAQESGLVLLQTAPTLQHKVGWLS